ncbi:MAG: hypothetical protein A2133_10695 [Actinobacteria bacterium RBG_16_64_13]|nr:MAG: hypothetical protein A2133_10695 [Actinobacteria bacterium RBG_16_64_13]
MELTKNSSPESECPQCGAPVFMPAYAEAAVCAFCGSTLTRTEVEAVCPAGLDKQTLRSVQCTQCAGPLDVFEGRRILVCGHCGVRVAVGDHSGFSRWVFPPRLNRLDAAHAGAAWLREYPGIAEDARNAHFVEARLVYAPIWEHRALVTGWEFGRKLRTKVEPVVSMYSAPFDPARVSEDVRLELKMVQEEVREPRLQERRYYQAATDFTAIDATRPRVTGRELLVPLLAGEMDPAAIVLEAEGTAEEVAETGRKVALQPVSGAMSPDSHLFAFRESTSLLFYPLWLVRFQQGNRLCRVVVNGRDGGVNSAIAPADNTRRMALLGGQLALLALAIAVLVWLAVTWESGRVSMAAAAVIVSAGAVLLAWRYRAVSEVEYHEPFSN